MNKNTTATAMNSEEDPLPYPLCGICATRDALFECSACNHLQFCEDCIVMRHKYGILSSHSFSIVEQALQKNRIQPPYVVGVSLCQFCELTNSTVYCPPCDMVFCKACAKKFHKVGGITWKRHTEQFQSSNSKAQDSNNNNNNNNNNNSSSVANNKSPVVNSNSNVVNKSPVHNVLNVGGNLGKSIFLSPLNGPLTMWQSPNNSKKKVPPGNRMKFFLGGTPPISPHSQNKQPLGVEKEASGIKYENFTFKLLAYGLGVNYKELLNVKEKIKYYINIDYYKQIVSCFGRKGDNSLCVSHSRAFRSIENAKISSIDPRYFSIFYIDSKPIGECLSTNKEEAAQICEILNQIACKEEDSEYCNLNEKPLFKGNVFKKGKMSWGPRWLIVKQNVIELMKSQNSQTSRKTIAFDNSIEVKPDPKKKKVFTLNCSSRPEGYVFKCDSEAERDTIVSIIETLAKENKDKINVLGDQQQGFGLKKHSPRILFDRKAKDNNNINSSNNNHVNYESKDDHNNNNDNQSENSSIVSAEYEVTSLPSTHITTITSSSSKSSGNTNHEHNIESKKIHTATNNDNNSNINNNNKNNDDDNNNNNDSNHDKNSLPSQEEYEYFNLMNRHEMSEMFLDMIDQESAVAPQKPSSFNAVLDKMQGSGTYEAKKKNEKPILFIEETFESILMNSNQRKHHTADYSSYNNANQQKVSDSLHSKVFSLMRLLHNSISEGAQIGSVIYVPRQAWFQQGVKFQAYPIKLEVFQYLLNVLLHLHPSDIEQVPEEFETALIQFRLAAEQVQNKLAQHLSFIHSIKVSVNSYYSNVKLDDFEEEGGAAGGGEDVKKKKKGLWASLKKKMTRGVSSAAKDKVHDTTRYVRLLSDLLQKALIFEDWNKRIEDDESKLDEDWGRQRKIKITEHLLCIMEFFHAVVCGIAIRDLKNVLKRYIKHCTRDLSTNTEW